MKNQLYITGAPWVSNSANKKIILIAKSCISRDKIEKLLNSILKNVWPDGKKFRRHLVRDEYTKMRTKMAAKMALFALSEDLKHVVGSETTRLGLLNFFQMIQNHKLNMRLVLIMLNHVLNTLYGIEN